MIKLRIPTQDTYAFVEIDLENKSNSVYRYDKSPEEIKEIYNEYMSVFNQKPLSVDLIKYLINLFNEDLHKDAWGKMSPDDYQTLSEQEKNLVQAIKRFYKRLPQE
jgi:hypothetical protein